MGIGELLVHTRDITTGLGVDWWPPVHLADVVLAGLVPDVAHHDPAAALLWATGRIDLPGRPRTDRWVWRAAASTPPTPRP